MIRHIDVGGVLRRNVCDLYSNLVTRPTGAAVRSGIEQQIAQSGGRSITIIDFANVSLLDFSCADEIVAKLVLKYCCDAEGPEAYFVFRGVSESHLDAIESVLERHRIAIVVERTDGEAVITGWLSEEERLAWQTVHTRRQSRFAVGHDDDSTDLLNLGEILEQLHTRRLLLRLDDGYVTPGEMVT